MTTTVTISLLWYRPWHRMHPPKQEPIEDNGGCEDSIITTMVPYCLRMDALPPS